MLRVTKDNLDIPINVLVEGASNTETYRDFIRNSEMEFGMEPEDIDTMSEDDLNDYIDFLDDLWGK